MRVFIADMPFTGENISENQIKSVNGTLFCMNVRFARTGVQYYLGRELGLMDRANEKIKVYRLAEDVFDTQSMQTFEAVDITDDHPAGDMVTTDNYLQYARGHAQNVRPDGIFLACDLAVKASSLITKVEGGKRQLSAGYWCDYEPYKDGYRQRNIVANHIAIVDKGRAGDKVLIRDEEIQDIGESLMTYTAEQVAALMNDQATKDAADTFLPAQTSSNDTLVNKMFDYFLGKAKPAKDDEDDDDKDEKKESKDSALEAKVAELQKTIDALIAEKTKTSDEDEDDDDEKKEAKDTVAEILATLDEDDDEEDDDKKEAKDSEAAYKAARDALKPALVGMAPAKQQKAKDALRVKFGKKPTSDSYLQIAKSTKDTSTEISDADIAAKIKAAAQAALGSK